MTDRLYYTDSTLQSFEAVVISSAEVDGRSHIVLDRTAFYPTSGGQPCDRGRLNAVDVVDVIDREDGAVVHVATGRLEPGTVVRGDVEWDRRLDHMQQHSGQHILSAAFDHLFGVGTASVHMGAEVSTVDLSREVTADEIDAAESEANRVVWDDRLVAIRFASADAVAAMGLRKPSARAGTVRLVEIAGCDLSACGGTHVGRTGMVGIIAVAGTERFKGGSRVSFLCGTRVMRSHRALRNEPSALTRLLSVMPGEISATVSRMQGEAKTAEKSIRVLQTELAGFRAAAIVQTAETIGGRSVVLRAEPEFEGPALKVLATALLERQGLVCALAGAGTPTPVIVARSADVDLDAGTMLRAIAGELGGRGGGRPEFAQGGIASSPTEIFEAARRYLRTRNS